MLKREDINKAKINRSVMTIFLLFAAAIAMIAMLLIWNGQITGFASLQTFESNITITGSSPDGLLSFDKIPNFIANVGDDIKFNVQANRDDVWFTDDSTMLNITREGKVEFTPSTDDIGTHNVWFIIKDDSGRYYYQNVIIIIED